MVACLLLTAPRYCRLYQGELNEILKQDRSQSGKLILFYNDYIKIILIRTLVAISEKYWYELTKTIIKREMMLSSDVPANRPLTLFQAVTVNLPCQIPNLRTVQ